MAIYGTGSNETLYGTEGNDVINAFAGDDRLNGDVGDDTLNGGDGNDYLFGGAGDDTLSGDPGNDTLSGDPGNDTLNGGAGDDTLSGYIGNDTLNGDAENDNLSGGDGNDTLNGGAGGDWLSGGAGDDTFIFKASVIEKKEFFVIDNTKTFAGWLEDHNLAVTTLKQNELATQYKAWLKGLVADHGLGTDQNGDGIIEVGFQQNDPSARPMIEGMTSEATDKFFGDTESIFVVTGKTTQERFYVNEFKFTTTETRETWTASSAEGHDVILDFVVGPDNLVFTLSPGTSDTAGAKLLDSLIIDIIDWDGNGVADDTRITFTNSPDWSITLIGVTGFKIDDVSVSAPSAEVL